MLVDMLTKELGSFIIVEETNEKNVGSAQFLKIITNTLEYNIGKVI